MRRQRRCRSSEASPHGSGGVTQGGLGVWREQAPLCRLWGETEDRRMGAARRLFGSVQCVSRITHTVSAARGSF